LREVVIGQCIDDALVLARGAEDGCTVSANLRIAVPEELRRAVARVPTLGAFIQRANRQAY
jgi:hypothetical protein